MAGGRSLTAARAALRRMPSTLALRAERCQLASCLASLAAQEQARLRTASLGECSGWLVGWLMHSVPPPVVRHPFLPPVCRWRARPRAPRFPRTRPCEAARPPTRRDPGTTGKPHPRYSSLRRLAAASKAGATCQASSRRAFLLPSPSPNPSIAPGVCPWGAPAQRGAGALRSNRSPIPTQPPQLVSHLPVQQLDNIFQPCQSDPRAAHAALCTHRFFFFATSPAFWKAFPACGAVPCALSVPRPCSRSTLLT